MTGSCRYCKAKVTLASGVWMHDGLSALVHMVKKMRDLREAT